MHPQPTPITRFRRRERRRNWILGFVVMTLMITSFGVVHTPLNEAWPGVRILGMHLGNFTEVAAVVGIVVIAVQHDVRILARRTWRRVAQRHITDHSASE